MIVDESDVPAAWSETKISVVDSKQQPMLRTRREHPVRLEAPFGDQVVDQDTDVSLVSA
jgi:hypothetical protein